MGILTQTRLEELSRFAQPTGHLRKVLPKQTEGGGAAIVAPLLRIVVANLLTK